MVESAPNVPMRGTATDDEPRPRRLRGLLKVVLLVLAALGLLIAFAPTLLSTGPARTRILAYASDRLGVRLWADGLSLSWVGAQSVTGLALEDADGHPAAKLGRLELRRGLLSLAMDGSRLGDVVLSEGEVWPEELAGIFRTAARPHGPEKPPAAPATHAARPTPLPDALHISNLTVHSAAGSLRITRADFTDIPGRCTGHCVLDVENAGERGTAVLDITLAGLATVAADPSAFGASVAGRYENLSLAPLREVLAAARVPLSGGGIVSGTLDVSRPPSGEIAARVTCDGRNVWLTGDLLGGDRPAFETLHLEADGTYAKDVLRVQRLAVESSLVTASASGTFNLASGTRSIPTGDGKVSLNADLAELAKVLQPFGLLTPESRLAGKAAFSGTVANQPTGFSGSGTLDVTDLAVHLAGLDIQEKTVHVPVGFACAAAGDVWRVNVQGMQSAILSGDLDGVIALGKAPSLDAKCDLVCDGQRVQAAVGSQMPAELKLTKSWHVVAKAAGLLRLEGPWNQRIAGLVGDGALELGAFDYRGLAGDQGRVEFRLAEGRLSLVRDPPSRFRLNEGTVLLAGAADLNRSPAPYTMNQKLLVLDRVKLNERVTKEFLKFTSPILALSVEPGGLLCASVDEASLPLGEGVRDLSDLRGQIWIQNFRAKITGALAVLIEYGGGSTEIPPQQLGPFDLDLHEGVFQIRGQDLTLHEGIVLQFNGTVSLKGPVNVVVSMPLTAPMLKKFGVSEKYLPLLLDQKVRVPIRGTIDKPKLDDSAMAREIARMAAEAMKRQAVEDIGKMLEGGPKKKDKKK